MNIQVLPFALLFFVHKLKNNDQTNTRFGIRKHKYTGYVPTLLFLIHQVKNNHETNTGIAVENHEYTDSRSHTFISSP